jgi:hypothetical protein
MADPTTVEKKLIDAVTELRHQFILLRYHGYVLEVEDAHFHHDSAVLLPDYECGEPEAGETPEDHISGLAILANAYLYAQANPDQKVVIAGHTDTTGSDAYNLTLSQMRADNVLSALLGDREKWTKLVLGKHKVEDYQQILKWISRVWAWPCDPGPINNTLNAATKAATKEFQKQYNVEFSASIPESGIVDKPTWEAFFDVYMAILANLLGVDDAGLVALRAGLTFLAENKKAVGCGENFPIEESRRNNYRSAINRRVEVLFFKPGKEPDLKCHPNPGSCSPKACEVYKTTKYSFDHIPCKPLRSAYQYRINLKLGETDALFDRIVKKDDTDTGVRQRLQAVGFLYEPLNSANITPVAKDAWDHFKVVIGKPSNDDACDELQKMVKEVIVDAGKFPDAGAFAKVRVPGTYCITDYAFNAAPSTLNHFPTEQNVWKNNAALGLVPLVATVEMRRRNLWGPVAAGTKVHFQLISPDEIAAGSPVATPALRSAALGGTRVMAFHTPPALPASVNKTLTLTGSPQSYVDNERKRNLPTADDPQVNNAHKSVAGKRGNEVAGKDRLANLLEIDNARTRFHDEFNFATAVKSPHPHAAVADLNAAGEAAVVFMPAWTGGDRYKLRVFIDPMEGRASDGSETWAVKNDTGTVVVSRVLRLSKYMRWDYPATSTAAQKTTCGGALDPFDTTGVITTEYQKAWLDVTVEPRAQAFQLITQADWLSAIRYAKGRARPATSQAYDLSALLPESDPASGLNNPSPGLIRFRTAAQYDAAPKAAAPPGGWPSAAADANFWVNMQRIFFSVLEEFMHFYTRNAIGGLTVIQAPVLASFSVDRPAGMPPSPWTNSGFGMKTRGCYVIFGHNVYFGGSFPYDHTRNALHETGHVLFGVHQYDNPPVPVFQGNEHDYHDMCIMGYQACSGDFCGRCVLNQAGWDIQAMPVNGP